MPALTPVADLRGCHLLTVRRDLWLGLSGVVLGVVIGTVAALLGVAGGELLIPTLLYLFGADIRTAGTASLMISIVTVASGLWRYRSLGALPDRDAMMPMALGSVLGAIVGGLLVSIQSIILLVASS